MLMLIGGLPFTVRRTAVSRYTSIDVNDNRKTAMLMLMLIGGQLFIVRKRIVSDVCFCNLLED